MAKRNKVEDAEALGRSLVPKRKSRVAAKPSREWISMQLDTEQVNWLDHLRLEAKTQGFRGMSRVMVIRSLIELAKESNIDLDSVRSPETFDKALREAISNHLNS